MPTTVVGSLQLVREFDDFPPDDVLEAHREISALLEAAGLPLPSAAPPQVLRTKIVASEEAVERHAIKVHASRGYLFAFNAASLTASALSIMYCIQAAVAGWAVYRLPPVVFHWLGTQVLWNTQPYDAMYTLPFTRPLSAVYILYALLAAAATCWKWWVWFSRNRDVGFNAWSRRGRITACFMGARLAGLAACAACSALFGAWPLPTVVDLTYSTASCQLSPVAGIGASGRVATTLEGDAAGACAPWLTDPNLLASERDYLGLVPEVAPAVVAAEAGTGTGGGANVTVAMPPFGPELGCDAGDDMFPLAGQAAASTLVPGTLYSSWLPFQSRPSRRCLSQFGYTMSNWFTFPAAAAAGGAAATATTGGGGGGGSCSALAYAQWLNETRVAGFGHAEQWFCAEAAPAVNATHVVVTYNTSGWLSVATGASCLTANDTATAAAAAGSAGPPAWPAAVLRTLAAVSGLIPGSPSPSAAASPSRSPVASSRAPSPSPSLSAAATPAPTTSFLESVTSSVTASNTASGSLTPSATVSGSATGTCSNASASASPSASPSPAAPSPTQVHAAEVAGLAPGRDLPTAVFARGAAAGLPPWPAAGSGNGSSSSSSAAQLAATAAAWAAWSPAAPDACTEARYACLVREASGDPTGAQYIRTASLHGCTRAAVRPAATSAYNAALRSDMAAWGTAAAAVVWAVTAEAAIEWGAAAVSACLF